MKFRKSDGIMSTRSWVDIDGLGYALWPVVTYHGPCQIKRIRWRASYKGKHISGITNKWKARRICEQHAEILAQTRKVKAGLRSTAMSRYQDYPAGVIEVGVALDAIDMLVKDTLRCIEQEGE